MDPMVADLSALTQVVLIDLALAGDNAIAVGLAAAALPEKQRRQVILIGIGLALALRIGFALVTIQLLAIPGLLLAGGLLLFWVAWRMWADLKAHGAGAHAAPEGPLDMPAPLAPQASFSRALLSIVIADVSMSLDNVLAVAGVARHAPEIMAFGLVLSVVLMGAAATFIAGLIQKYRWIAYLGLIAIIFAAIRMVWEDGHTFLPDLIPALPSWLKPPHPPA
jgi:YjbE family integral membrane protein